MRRPHQIVSSIRRGGEHAIVAVAVGDDDDVAAGDDVDATNVDSNLSDAFQMHHLRPKPRIPRRVKRLMTRPVEHHYCYCHRAMPVAVAGGGVGWKSAVEPDRWYGTNGDDGRD